jgi:hypothetical protein
MGGYDARLIARGWRMVGQFLLFAKKEEQESRFRDCAGSLIGRRCE